MPRRRRKPPAIGIESAYPETVVERGPTTPAEAQRAAQPRVRPFRKPFEFQVSVPTGLIKPADKVEPVTGLAAFQAQFILQMQRLALLGAIARQRGRQRAPVGTAGTPGGGLSGTVNDALKEGFRRAGRPDLVRMVDTAEFGTWVRQESGGRPTAVSPANNMGLPNGGLFQFWAGHSWARPYFHGNRFTMPVWQQAMYACTKFNLTPDRIIGFARSIRAGRYSGWG